MTTTTDNGLQVLDGGQLRLLRAIDAAFLRLARTWEAPEFRFPFLIGSKDLDTFDYFDNFPHLGLAATRLDPKRLGSLLAEVPRPLDRIPAEVMEPTGFALPSAACYAIYLDLAGSELPRTGRCGPRSGPASATRTTTTVCSGCSASPCGRSSS